MKKLTIIFILFLLSTSNVFSEITYLEILKNPTDLKLNLQFAKEQETKKNFKSVIATLERLTNLYPSNIDLKLYLLSMSIKTDSTEKTINLIQEIQSSNQISDEVKKQVAQVFDDMNKKKIDQEIVEKKKARENKKLAAAKKQKNQSEKITPWTWYTEVGYTNMLNSNIGNISESKTQFSGGNPIAMSGTQGDNVTTLKSLWGAIYQIDQSSNISMTASHSTSEQNRATSDENDTQSFSATYSKSLQKNSITSTYSGNETKTKNAANSITHSLNVDNRFALTDNQKILTGINTGFTKGNQNSSNASKRKSNTSKMGFVIGHEYFFTPQHNIKIKYAFTDTKALADYNALQDQTLTASYSKNLKIGNLGLTYSLSDKDYQEADTFINSLIVRKDNLKTKTISFNGNLNQLISIKKILPVSEKTRNFLNTLNYNASWSETESEGSLLQHNYIKESFTFGLTKRVYF